MARYDSYTEMLVSFQPAAQAGWFAFFYDGEDEECPIWAEPIIAWGLYDVHYQDDEEQLVDGREVRAMKAHTETGMLESYFLDANNFLGIFMSGNLALPKQCQKDMVYYEEIKSADPALTTRLEAIIQVLLDHQVMGTPDYGKSGEEQEENLN